MLLKACQLYDEGKLHLSNMKPITLTSSLTLCGKKFRFSNPATSRQFDFGRDCCTFCAMRFNRTNAQLSRGRETLRDKILGAELASLARNPRVLE